MGIIEWLLIGNMGKTIRNSRAKRAMSVPGFHYAYIDNGTGMAFNLDENKVLLCKGKHSAIYDRNSIRNVEWIRPGAEYTKIYGSIIALPFNFLWKLRAKQSVKEKSGIFFQVADINNPEWFVHCGDERRMKQLFEIITQFMEGTLQKPVLQPKK